VNTMLMAFSGFSLVLLAWVLWVYKMGFGSPLKLGPGILGAFVGIPGSVIGHLGEQGQAHIPLLDGAMPKFRFPQSTLVYFQFVFAAITPLLFLGSVVGRVNFRVAAVRAAVVDAGVLGERFPAVGRGLVGAAGRAGLQRRLRHPPGRRHFRICGRRRDRAPAGSRSRSSDTQ
jgi:hypothetical protein